MDIEQPSFGAGNQGRKAYDYMKRSLLDGQFAAGDSLPIPTIAKHLQMSRQPVLDAIRRLASEGLLEIVPQVGCRVANHGVDQIQDFYRLFARVEALVARFAAERGNDVEFDELRIIASRLDAFEASQPTVVRTAAYLRHNREFHSAIHQMARSPEIAGLAHSFWDRSEFYINNAGSQHIFSDRLETAISEHQDLAEAIAARDGAAASTQMIAHVEGFLPHMFGAVGENAGPARKMP